MKLKSVRGKFLQGLFPFNLIQAKNIWILISNHTFNYHLQKMSIIWIIFSKIIICSLLFPLKEKLGLYCFPLEIGLKWRIWCMVQKWSKFWFALKSKKHCRKSNLFSEWKSFSGYLESGHWSGKRDWAGLIPSRSIIIWASHGRKKKSHSKFAQN